VLTIWLSFAMRPDPGQQRSILLIAVPLAISVVFIALGILTRKLKTPAIITATMVVIVVGFALDLLIAFNVVKAIIDVAVIALVIKTGKEALEEAKPTLAAESTASE